MKQTVEQAAEQRWPLEDNETKHFFSSTCRNAFIAGADWQRQQGIEWVELTRDNWPPMGEYVLVLLEGEIWLKGRVKYADSGLNKKVWTALFLDGEHRCEGRIVTHYAYITLPINSNSNATKESKENKQVDKTNQ